MSIHLSRRRRSLAIVGAFAASALVLSACTNSSDAVSYTHLTLPTTPYV